MDRRSFLIKTSAIAGSSLPFIASGGIPIILATSEAKIRWSRRRRELALLSVDKVVLSAVGDTIMVKPEMYYKAPINTRTLYGILRDSDLALATLSTTLADWGGPERKDVFIAPTGVAEDLMMAGIDIVTIATNHLLDMGKGGLEQTLAVLKRHNINAVGGGKNLKAATSPTIRTVKEQRIAFLGFHASLNWEKPRGSVAATSSSPGVVPIRAKVVRIGFNPSSSLVLPSESDLSSMEKVVRQARRSADYVVTCLNFSWEFYRSLDSNDQVPRGIQMLAQAAVDAGSNLVLGSGTHRIYPVEKYKESYIFYGTGNFFFQLFDGNKPAARYGLFPETQEKIRKFIGRSEFFESFLVRVILSQGKIFRFDLIPFVLSTEGDPSMASDEQASRILAYIKKISKPLGTTIDTDEWHGWIQQEEEK